ncbi:MAG: GNAT family N-acetyltransferase [Candidatus Thermoplasmatota archaeon]|nr:GNAT family N-acetyltransferase [Candidatus Thermoplasmatota archaeon]
MIEEVCDKSIIPKDLLMLADPSEEMIDSYLDRSICYVHKEKDRILGVIIMIDTRPLTREIINVSVQEDHHNRGIGKALILQAIERSKNDGIKTLEIGTGNPGAIQMLLYQKCGFRIIGVEPDHFRIHYKERIFENGIECRDMVRMRMEL